MTDLAVELRLAQNALRKRPKALAGLDLHQDVRLWGWVGLTPAVVDQFGRYHPAANGHSEYDIRCPFCGSMTTARSWSLAGSGKRCSGCPAIHCYGVTLRARASGETQPLPSTGEGDA